VTSWEREKRGEMSEADKEWCREILYMYGEKGDPTRSSSWDRDKCARLMPAFLAAWDAHTVAEDTLDRVASTYEREVS